MFNRVDLIQLIINKINAKTYLEIGVFNGYSFLNIKCSKKLGIDPDFKIKTGTKLKSYFKNYTNINNKYFEMTSDAFFDNYSDELRENPPQVIFIDGLHTFEQTLKDCYNSLNYLSPGGAIIMHDCNPPHAASATPAQSIPEAEKKWKEKNTDGWTDEWCGDSWKTIPYLIKNNLNLYVSVLNTDYGLGIITKRDNTKDKYQIANDLDSYKKMTYDDLAGNRKKMLNLIELNELNNLMKDIF